MHKSSPALDIQRATSDDLDSIWAIIETCADWLVQAKGFDHWKKYYSRTQVDNKIKSQRVYLARIDSSTVATITLDFNPVSYFTAENMSKFTDSTAKAGYITAMAVLPEFQGQGIASGLMVFVEQLARKEAAQYLRLDCRASYQELVAFYDHNNFKRVGAIFDPKNAKYFLMEKALL